MSPRYRQSIGLRLEVELREVESQTLKNCMSNAFLRNRKGKTLYETLQLQLQEHCKSQMLNFKMLDIKFENYSSEHKIESQTNKKHKHTSRTAKSSKVYVKKLTVDCQNVGCEI